jgi:hypothetical protein
MSPGIDLPSRDTCDCHGDRHQLWDRLERAVLFAHYLDLQAQGVSQRQAATQLQVPRTTLQAWQSWQATLDICPHVAQWLFRRFRAVCYAASYNTRCRRRASCIRPYPLRLISFRQLMWPSTGPFD